MMPEVLTKLAGLSLVTLVALGALWQLLRVGEQPPTRLAELLAGYPADRFPDRGLVQLPALRELAASQARLLAIYAQLPPEGEPAIWLLAFLRELRAIMDTAYRAAGVARLYGEASPLTALSGEVTLVEQEVAAQIARRLLHGDGDAQRELLDARLAALRLCARQLAV